MVGIDADGQGAHDVGRRFREKCGLRCGVDPAAVTAGCPHASTTRETRASEQVDVPTTSTDADNPRPMARTNAPRNSTRAGHSSSPTKNRGFKLVAASDSNTVSCCSICCCRYAGKMPTSICGGAALPWLPRAVPASSSWPTRKSEAGTSHRRGWESTRPATQCNSSARRPYERPVRHWSRRE